MDPGSLAALITAIGAFIVGIAGLWLSHRKDTTAAKSTARDVATKAAEAAVSSLNAALNRAQMEIEILLKRVDELEEENNRLRTQVFELQASLVEETRHWREGN